MRNDLQDMDHGLIEQARGIDWIEQRFADRHGGGREEIMSERLPGMDGYLVCVLPLSDHIFFSAEQVQDCAQENEWRKKMDTWIANRLRIATTQPAPRNNMHRCPLS
jgi:hypothetical protein